MSTTNQCNSTCSNLCLSCSNSATNCTVCIRGYFLYGSTCMKSCPLGTYPVIYPNLYTGLCLICDSSCVNCIGPNANQCTQCSSSSLLISPPMSKCINYIVFSPVKSLCLSQYYFDMNIGTCLKCSNGCLNCTNWSFMNCTSCFSDYSFQIKDYNSSTGLCILDSELQKSGIPYWISLINITGNNNVSTLAAICFSFIAFMLLGITFYKDINVRVMSRQRAVDYIMVNEILDP